MVYCRKLKDGKCEYTGGKCFLKHPKTIEDFKVCPRRELAKHYSEMDMLEKAFHNSIENYKEIAKLKKRLFILERQKPNTKLHRKVKNEETRWQKWKRLIFKSGW
jgi:hypothetical protein